MALLGRVLRSGRNADSVAIPGECRNRIAFAPYPGMFCWLSLARREMDGEVAWGEHQDVWPPGSWRAKYGAGST